MDHGLSHLFFLFSLSSVLCEGKSVGCSFIPGVFKCIVHQQDS
uniref:Uncharacterized protein n=1 Tax=Anguilla anguilla TaxID=7936 RepID=A0A0E9SST4_ANGAN